MNVEKLKGGWEKCGSVISFPYDWQRPARTEEWIYENLKKNNSQSKFIEFICFPWASLIDLLEREKHQRASILINALNNLPPKRTLIRATACQHIKIDLIIPYLKKHKFNNLFWAHKPIKFDNVGSIQLHPMALYPVMFYMHENIKIVPEKNRKYKYSFVGAYNEEGYISDIREKIYRLPYYEQAVIIKRKEWHYETAVYGCQVNELEFGENIKLNLELNETEYKNILVNSLYSLCPSGAGPNSIRLWESLALSVAPVILSDNLELPDFIKEINIKRVKENDLNYFIKEIKNNNIISDYKIDNCIAPERFIENIIIDLFETKFIKKYLNLNIINFNYY